jgi:HAD superfamily hydrolase (TIGR01509 family)
MEEMADELKAIFFDVGNTLLFPDRKTILHSLYQRNRPPTLEQWHAIERETKNKFDDLMQHGGSVDHSFWRMFYRRLLEDLALSDDALCEELVTATRQSANWCEIRPGTREILERLGKRYALGVISNADGQIAAVLRRCGIADCFESITDSGLMGHEKPHPAIFEEALRTLKARPKQSLYVGDVYSVDYLGATRAGMQAILFDVAGTYREMQRPRVQSLEELEKQLRK